MSLVNNKTGELWRSFIVDRKLIKSAIEANRYSMQSFDPSYFANFNPKNEFEKWAVVEVENFDDVPEGIKTKVLPRGLYAVFFYTGSSAKGAEVFQYIFASWLPGSGYILDSRPHFKILGENYKRNDPDSEEEIWIPIKSS